MIDDKHRRNKLKFYNFNLYNYRKRISIGLDSPI